MWKKLSSRIFEIRFSFCPRSSNGASIRQFLNKEYLNIKAQNPSLPILIRECSDVAPKLTMRYALGRESTIYCEGLDHLQIQETLLRE